MTFDHLLPSTSTEKIILERLRIGAQHQVSNYILQNMEVTQFADNFFDGVMFRFESDVLAKTLSTTTAQSAVTFEAPASTWQMFKHTHRDGRWLGWLARRWPVVVVSTTKYAKFEVKERAAFPDCTIQFPKDLGKPIFFQTVEGER